ncbi:cell wall / vacuolar inhibitor of fructosidase 1 [Ricinus communis]|uniref:C, putative n=1 Tax=Ricinus communis TaxID=3988 RepID=B9SHN2_RICCO|nr:cell wall / vacuolar inhibitor of fructosidase 1 [Ricinus communis]EEF36859.1 C, putative [Ricinus communis]|eukprot:XP_002525501.1 cell wall / vacuolar inhibitor of fructosidase 1 [Ricinus communis]
MKSFLLVFVFIFPVINAAIPSIFGSNLIEKTCRKTPYYQLCISTLVSNPHSFDADIEGLAKIMVHTIDAKATHTLNRINELLEQSQRGSRSHDQKEQQELRDCADRYNEILKGDVPQAMQALHKGNFRSAKERTFDAAAEAISCEEEFSGQSPLSDMNMKVHDISVVAASILKQIHRNRDF